MPTQWEYLTIEYWWSYGMGGEPDRVNVDVTHGDLPNVPITPQDTRLLLIFASEERWELASVTETMLSDARMCKTWYFKRPLPDGSDRRPNWPSY